MVGKSEVYSTGAGGDVILEWHEILRVREHQQRWWARESARVRHARRNNHKADEGSYALTVDSPKWDVILPWPLASGNAVTKSCTKKQRLSFNIAYIQTTREAGGRAVPPFLINVRRNYSDNYYAYNSYNLSTELY